MRGLAVATLLLVAAAGGASVLRADAAARLLDAQRYEPGYYVPPPEWLAPMSLGHREALADLLWMKALVYFGDELVHRGDVAHALRYADAILSLDPDFRKVYHWAGMAGMYRPSAADIADIRASIEFLERGARRFPDDPDMAWDLGASLAYELAPHIDDPVEKDEILARGTEHMMTAARLGGGPAWLTLTNATTLRRLGQTEQAIRHLEEMYATVDDEDVRRQIGIELAVLRDRSYAEAFEQAHLEAEERRRRDFPYVAPTLHLLLGARPPIDPAGPWLRDDLGSD
jgi:tetratricopeptide (TPR) repeat protein